jgi:apolipoprotein D and lipocalin family protein
MSRAALLFAFAALAPATFAEAVNTPPATAPSVDLSRYVGQWFEVARYPNRFQAKCSGDVVVTYTRRDDGRITVDNRCRRADGSIDRAVGLARLASDDGSNAKLKVRFAPAALSFLPMVWADYWVLEVADDYSHAIVGTPDRKYLWLLSRTPTVSERLYAKLVAGAAAKGFDTARLQPTANSGDRLAQGPR